MSTPGTPAEYVRSYLTLRMTIGVLGLLLPVLLVAVVLGRDGVLLGSLSEAYHHRYANSVFIGVLSAVAAFLWAYQYSRAENRVGNVAALAALVVVVVPTPLGAARTTEDRVGGVLHFAGATVFLLALAAVCVVWAHERSPGEPLAVYRISAVLIVLAVVAAAGLRVATTLVPSLGPLDLPFLVAEVVAVEVFGFSWLVRGGVGQPRALLGVAVVAVALVVLVLAARGLLPVALPLLAGIAGIGATVLVLGVLAGARAGARRNRHTAA